VSLLTLAAEERGAAKGVFISLPFPKFPHVSESHLLLARPVTMVNFRDPSVILQDAGAYTFPTTLCGLSLLRPSLQWCSPSYGTLWVVFTCEYIRRSRPTQASPASPAITQPYCLAGNTSLLSIMSGVSLGDVALTAGRYGSVDICASFGFLCHTGSRTYFSFGSNRFTPLHEFPHSSP